ncbi:hypothetical protein BD769DRAFT_1425639, partial [Suillus cothurnatus]
ITPIRSTTLDEPQLDITPRRYGGRSAVSIEDAPLTGIIEYGVDFLDVSSGASCPKAITKASPAYRASFAQAVKQAVGDNLTVWAAGSITDDKIAQEILDKGQADVVLVERFSKRTRGLLGSNQRCVYNLQKELTGDCNDSEF